MPENRQVQSNGVSASSNGQADNLEESMRQLKIQTQDNQDVVVAQAGPYPDRPGEPDCIYYLRTGLCGYGSRCRFNHPTYLQGRTSRKGRATRLPGRYISKFDYYLKKLGEDSAGSLTDCEDKDGLGTFVSYHADISKDSG